MAWLSSSPLCSALSSISPTSGQSEEARSLRARRASDTLCDYTLVTIITRLEQLINDFKRALELSVLAQPSFFGGGNHVTFNDHVSWPWASILSPGRCWPALVSHHKGTLFSKASFSQNIDLPSRNSFIPAIFVFLARLKLAQLRN